MSGQRQMYSQSYTNVIWVIKLTLCRETSCYGRYILQLENHSDIIWADEKRDFRWLIKVYFYH